MGAGGADDAVVRYRCGACGNRTRFDVVATRRTRSFHHFTLGGELAIEETEVLAETVEAVSCRWCGGTSVEIDAGAGADGADPDPAEPFPPFPESGSA